jgi:protein-tyrosine phosphatase
MFSFGAYYGKGQKVLDREGDLGEIWISGYDFAHNLAELKKNNITAVCSGVDLHFTYPEEFVHLKFNLNDCHTQDATHTFRPAYEWIDDARKSRNVLVHCAAGISRCSTLLIAYLMQKYGWNFEYCLTLLQEKRPCCQPNTGFCKQLKEL